MPQPVPVERTLSSVPVHSPLPINEFVRSLGEIATRAQLREGGFSVRTIAWAVGNGTILRIRRAWYSSPGADRERVRAVMLGGRLGGASAARSYGLWTGLDRNLHVSWDPHGNVAKPGRLAARFPGNRTLEPGVNIVSHWRLKQFSLPCEEWRESIVQTLAQVIPTMEFRDAVACCDSAINSKQVTAHQVRRIVEALPARVRRVGDCVDGSAASGIETYLRLWFDQESFSYRTQMKIGKHTVDFLIGTSLIVEADGEDFHSDDERFEADRRRTAYLQSRGYTVIRLSYTMIMFLWPDCERVVRSAIARGRHLDNVH